MAMLCFAYFAYRYQPPFEVCICAERHLRNCDGLTNDNLAYCKAGLDNQYDVPDDFYLQSNCDGYFRDGWLSMDPWTDIGGNATCYRYPYEEEYDYAQCEDTCYVLNDFLSRDVPNSNVDRHVRDAYGLPEYFARWNMSGETDGVHSDFGTDANGEPFTHMWAFAGTYPTYVTQQKAYFFAIVSIFGTMLSIISWMEAIKGCVK